jgi:hypothetical protein
MSYEENTQQQHKTAVNLYWGYRELTTEEINFVGGGYDGDNGPSGEVGGASSGNNADSNNTGGTSAGAGAWGGDEMTAGGWGKALVEGAKVIGGGVLGNAVYDGLKGLVSPSPAPSPAPAPSPSHVDSPLSPTPSSPTSTPGTFTVSYWDGGGYSSGGNGGYDGSN